MELLLGRCQEFRRDFGGNDDMKGVLPWLAMRGVGGHGSCEW